MTDTTTTATGDQTSATQAQTSDQTTTTTATTTTPAAEPHFTANWAADLRTSQFLVNAKSPEDVGRAYLNLEKRLGVPAERLLTIPDKPDDAEGWGKVFNALGRPEKVEGYGVQLSDKATAEDKAFVDKFTAAAHAAGASTAVVQAAIGTLNEATEAAIKAAEEKAVADKEACQATLAKEWGAKADVYQKEIGKFVEDTLGAEAFARLNEAGFGNNVDLMRLLAKVVDLRAEPENLPGGERNGGGSVVLTPDQARAQRLALENDPVKGVALRDASHGQHASVVAERKKLLLMEQGKAA